MTADRYDIAIVGAGIFGCALAFELARRTRMRIVLLDRKHTSAGASSRNVGRVRAFQLTPELTRLSMAAQAKHARLTDDLGHNTLYWRNGYALVLYDADEMEVMAGVQKMLVGDFGLKTELLGPEAAVQRMPVLEGGVKPAGALFRQDASAHHDAVMHGYRKALLRAGVELREQTPVTGLLRSGDRIEGVMTAQGEIRAGLVVNATGAWSSTLSAMAGVEVPNLPLRREAMVTEAVKPFMDTLVTFYRPTEGWLNQTLRGEVVMGVVDEKEQPSITLESSPEFAVRTASTMLAKAPVLGQLRIVRQWAGMYDVTPDRKATVGPVAERPGFVQLNGDNGRGFLLGPVLGELVAEWLDTGARPELLAPYDVARFAGVGASTAVSTDYYAGYRKTA
jgi:sarcosine oxidase subunit beta